MTIGRQHAAKHAGEFLERIDRFKKARDLTLGDMLLVMALAIACQPPEVVRAFVKYLDVTVTEMDQIRAAKQGNPEAEKDVDA